MAPKDPYHPWSYPCKVPSHSETEPTYVTHRKLCKWQCVNSEAFHERHFGFHFTSWITCSRNLTTMLSILQIPWRRPFLKHFFYQYPVSTTSVNNLGKQILQLQWSLQMTEAWKTFDHKLTERPWARTIQRSCSWITDLTKTLGNNRWLLLFQVTKFWSNLLNSKLVEGCHSERVDQEKFWFHGHQMQVLGWYYINIFVRKPYFPIFHIVFKTEAKRLLARQVITEFQKGKQTNWKHKVPQIWAFWDFQWNRERLLSDQHKVKLNHQQ